MKILVIAIGAIGGVTAGILASKGYHVDVVCNTVALTSKINESGLRYKVNKKTFIQKVNAYLTVKDTPGNYDFAILATKATQMDQPALAAKEKLATNGLLVSFQDGYCETKLARILGSEKIIGAMVGFGATLIEPGYSEMTSMGEIIIGNLDGTDDQRLDELEYILDNIVPTYVVRNIEEHVYSKLIINSCVTSIGAISGLRLGKILMRRKMRRLFLDVITEAIQVTNKLNIEIPDYSGRLNYYRLVYENNIFVRFWQHSYMLLFGIKYRKVKSSALQSLERGEHTEIDFLNGYIVDKAQELGIHVPINKRIVEILHEIESNKRKIGLSNFNDCILVR